MATTVRVAVEGDVNNVNASEVALENLSGIHESTSTNDVFSKSTENHNQNWIFDLQNAGLLSLLLFLWPTRFIKFALQQNAEVEDVWRLRRENRSEYTSVRLQTSWDLALKRYKNQNSKISGYENEKEKGSSRRPKLWKLVVKTFWKNILLGASFKCLWLAAVMVTNVVFLVNLLDILGDLENQETIICCNGLVIPYKAFLYSFLFFIGELARSFSVHNFWQFMIWLGLDCRSGLIVMLFEKLLRLRGGDSEVGTILNMIQNDVERIRDCSIYCMFIFTTPIILLIVVFCGKSIIGDAIYFGLLVLVLSVPIQAMIGKKAGELRRNAIKLTDERVTLMGEILKAIQLIKLYAWEDPFAKKVHEVRSREIKQLRHTAYLKSFNSAFSQSLVLVTSAVTFGFHTLVFGKPLTPQEAFAVLAIFNVARFPLSVLPLAIRLASESLVAFTRIEDFLLLEESTQCQLPQRLPFDSQEPAVSLENVLLRRKGCVRSSNDASSPEPTGTDIFIENLEAQVGTLTCVTGCVGSGKTSLLVGGLLGEMQRFSGKLIVRGSIAYVSQRPWVFNGTVRDNICLSSVYDEEKYAKVIFACALQPDLDTFPAGDMTELGERGINISGGQKTRIALARAIYTERDVYILDDILSAFDANVSTHVWNECIQNSLRDKTVILATHALNFLPEADNIVVMKNCRIIAQGTYAELVNSPFITYIKSETDHLSSKEEENVMGDIDIYSEMMKGKERSRSRFDSVPSSKQMGKLIEKEDKKLGALSRETLKAYVTGFGGWAVACAVFSLFWIAEGCKAGSDIWLTVWVDNRQENESELFYFGVYLAFTLAGIILLTLRGGVFARRALHASIDIHDKAFSAVIKASMPFFYVTPLGRVLNRFSGDIDKVDVFLVDVAELTLSFFVRCIISIVIIVSLLPWFLLAVIPLAIFYSKILKYCRNVLRQAKRIDGISRSPLIGQIQSTVQGLTTIRAFDVVESYRQANMRLVDVTTRAQIAFMFTNRWIGIRLDFITTSIVTICAMFCVLFASQLTSGVAGLVLISALQTAGIFQYGTRQAAELEALFTAVERIRHFIENTPSEKEITDCSQSDNHSEDEDGKYVDATIENEPSHFPASVLAEGTIEFQSFSARYRDKLPLVLKQVSFRIEGGTKAALVGRTGSGKSSTLLCLYRLIEASTGKILIDGKDISLIPLSVLRTELLSVVPQSAILFSGTIRTNLDPFNRYSDEEIWNALNRVHLRENKAKTTTNNNTSEEDCYQYCVRLGAHEGAGLDYVVEEGGKNLSKGQRQLFCFARALLKKSKIITIDEGTSSVDEKSDSLIQQTLKEAFPNRTMVIIAHRLNTIRHVDRICVLDNGQVAEVGSPDELLEIPGGRFAEMWKAQVFQKGSRRNVLG